MDSVTSSGDAVEQTLKEILVSDLYVDVPIEEIGIDDGLQDELGLDSLGFVELRAQCEQCFDVSIADTDFSPTNFRSIGTVAALVRDLRQARAVSS